jgi:PTS system nitrogen regulatory IIA component
MKQLAKLALLFIAKHILCSMNLMSSEDFDVDGLAEYLHLTPTQIQRMASRDKLPGRKIGGEWKFSQPEIHRWLEERIGVSDQQELEQVENVFQQQDRKRGQAKDVRIADLLKVDAMVVPLTARSRSAIISEICKQAADVGLVWEPEKMAEAIRQRENLHSTALDNGMALLHPRQPMPNIIGEPFLSLAKSHQGVPFGGPRGQLTDIFFLIASTEDRGHLRTLARLSRLISDPALISVIRTAETSAAIYQLIVEVEDRIFPD